MTPKHYQIKPEPLSVIQDWELNFALGNVVKYIARAGRKPGNPALQDLEKAQVYLDREIKRRKENESH